MMQTSSKSADKTLLIATLTLLSWLGAYVHTTMELQLPVWRPENSFPALVGLALFLSWWRQDQRRQLWAWLLLTWTAGGHLLAGALLSVLPLPFLPFVPEQSAGHYLSHVIYGIAQLPLIWVLWKEIRKGVWQ